jgi:hypothetical protein
MKLRRNIHADWKINITAQSPVKIETEMLEHSADGNLFSVKGNPIIGEYDIYAQEGLELWCQTSLSTTFQLFQRRLYTRITQQWIDGLIIA